MVPYLAGNSSSRLTPAADIGTSLQHQSARYAITRWNYNECRIGGEGAWSLACGCNVSTGRTRGTRFELSLNKVQVALLVGNQMSMLRRRANCCFVSAFKARKPKDVP